MFPNQVRYVEWYEKVVAHIAETGDRTDWDLNQEIKDLRELGTDYRRTQIHLVKFRATK